MTIHFVCSSNPSLQSEDVATIADTEELINFDSRTKFMVCVYSGCVWVDCAHHVNNV